MKRTALPLRTAPLRRTGRLRPRSAKTARTYVQRRVLVAGLLEQRPWCEFPDGCSERAVDVHELRGRGVGGSILDLDNCRTSCRFHNGWAEDSPAAAYAIGWKARRELSEGRRMTAALSPDCAAGKCGACVGDGWDADRDAIAPCPCACHHVTHSVPVLSGRPRPARASTYRSGHCGIGKHDACLGVYAGTDCTCWCHTAATVRVWGTFSWRCETCGANGAAHETEGSAHAAANRHLDCHGIAP